MIGKLHTELGRATVILLSQAAGGRLITIPHTFKAGSQIDQVFGPQLAILLIDTFPGDRIYIPLHPSVPRCKPGTIKTAQVLAMKRKGMTAEAISAKLRISVRAVRYHFSKIANGWRSKD